VRGQARAAAPWPDDAARAFAVRFVSAYLERSSRDPKADARVVAGFASPELAGELPARWEERAPRQAVRSAVVSGAVALDARRVLVTVAATVAAARVSAWLVTVPVARDAGGGLVVYDLPSLAPALATVGRELGEPLLGSEGAEVRDVLSRFLRAYLAGDAGGLMYLVPPGTRVGAATGGFELVELGLVAAAGTRDRRLGCRCWRRSTSAMSSRWRCTRCASGFGSSAAIVGMWRPLTARLRGTGGRDARGRQRRGARAAGRRR
jgi:hypothetical protein